MVEPCGHAGDGNIHTEMLRQPSMTDEEWKRATHACLVELYAKSKELGGQLSGEHGIGNGRLEFLRPWYGLRYAYTHKTYDYRAFGDSFYGKSRVLFSNLYEVTYLILIATATSAAFATGGSTLNTLFGIPYWLCTLAVGIVIFIISMYGTNLVRKAASTVSVLIIIGLVVVLVPNIFAQFGTITESIGWLAVGEVPVGSTESGLFGAALKSAILYFMFQLPSIGLMYQHTEPLTDIKQVDRAALYMFLCNFIAMMLAAFGMLAIAFEPELEGASIPMLVLVQNGVGATILTPVISVLIILGAVSTGVNMIAGIVTRTVNALERRMESAQRQKGGSTFCYLSQYPLCKISVQIICCIFTHCKSHFQTANLKTYVRTII